MMKLILSVTLLWMLSSSAEALQCLRGNGSSTDRHTCRSDDESCVTVATLTGATKRDWRVTGSSCMPSSLCTLGNNSITVFSYSNSSEMVYGSIDCCNIDGCKPDGTNRPSPDSRTPNGLQCFSCIDDPGCNETVQCVGIQDRCINVNVTVQGDTRLYRGCVSANMCEALSLQKVRTALAEYLNITTEPTCCGSSLCNSAWTVRLSVGPLLLGLVALIVF